jgi:glycosyltransferase involved in cell wall biosynthesis
VNPEPLVSVVVPYYNHARYVIEALESIEAQSWRPLEIVVVDDGSSDGSLELLRKRVPRLQVDRTTLIEQPNRGAHEAIMRGIAAARGDFIAILNSDDAYHPDRIATLLPLLLNGDAQLAFSGVEFIDAGSNVLPPDHAWPSWYRRCFEQTVHCPTIGFAILAHNYSVSSGNFLFSRPLYESLSGFSSHRFCHDWDFLIRSMHYAEPAFDRRPLIRYRIHETNTTETVRDLLRTEATDALHRYIELTRRELPPNPLAPCPQNWPRYFETFAADCEMAFAPVTLLDVWKQAIRA